VPDRKEMKMKEENILKLVDHTQLLQTSTWEEVKELCEDAVKYNTASVCIPPCYVKQAKEYVGDRIKICTVIGFPNGNHTTRVKVFETEDAVLNGADEIDMVINIGALKEKNYDYVAEDIRQILKACQGRILKVIIETCLLTKEEKIKMCEIVTETGADFIKTSTGFSTGGATFEDIELFSKHIGPKVKMKASGGISSISDAERFMELGAERLGTSRIVKIIKSRG
jgi:deoxyribose-phosphate aldolase